MSELDVVVVRLKNNEEIIGISGGIQKTDLYIEFPHYIRYESSSNSLGIVPYCPFSDQVEYTFNLDDVQFVVPAKKIVSEVFVAKIIGLDDAPEAPKTFTVSGNYTSH